MIFLPILPGLTFLSHTHFDKIFQSISDDPWEHDFVLKVSWSYQLYSTILMVHDPIKVNHLLWKGQIKGYYFCEPMRS